MNYDWDDTKPEQICKQMSNRYTINTNTMFTKIIFLAAVVAQDPYTCKRRQEWKSDNLEWKLECQEWKVEEPSRPSYVHH